jgi:hypothetical protein
MLTRLLHTNKNPHTLFSHRNYSTGNYHTAKNVAGITAGIILFPFAMHTAASAILLYLLSPAILQAHFEEKNRQKESQNRHLKEIQRQEKLLQWEEQQKLQADTRKTAKKAFFDNLSDAEKSAYLEEEYRKITQCHQGGMAMGPRNPGC